MFIPTYCECGRKAVASVRGGKFVSVDKNHDQCPRCFESLMDSLRAQQF